MVSKVRTALPSLITRKWKERDLTKNNFTPNNSVYQWLKNLLITRGEVLHFNKIYAIFRVHQQMAVVSNKPYKNIHTKAYST